LIEEYVPEGARVLDIGCGDGSLLRELIEGKGVDGCGIDIDLQAAQECIARGVPVYHGDMLDGMEMFADNSFDCVILSQTLQQTLRPVRVVREMLRVGRKAIISFPNFAHWRVRLQLLLRGRMPLTHVLPHTWYDTPNIHLVTIRDFKRLCREENLKIVDSIYLTPRYSKLPGLIANLAAALAIFVLEHASGKT